MSDSENEQDAPSPQAPQTDEGRSLETPDPATRHEVLVKARDYRGDVTVHTRDGEETGFLYDYGPDTDPPRVRLLRPDGQRVRLAPESVCRVVFSGRDTAFGRSWEAWMKLKQQGKKAELYPEPLPEDPGETGD